MSNTESSQTDSVDVSILQDPDFKRLLIYRSRLRWILSGVLIAPYLAWALAGIYFSEAMGTPFPGTPVSWSIVLGYVIIALSIVLSLIYVRIINWLYQSHRQQGGRHDD